MEHPPTVIFYKSKGCGHCLKLAEIWDKSTSSSSPSVVSILKKTYPKIRTITVEVENNGGSFDENVFPKDLIRYRAWFPMILLVPGPVWDAANAQLGPKNEAKLKAGVQVLNGSWGPNEKGQEALKYVAKYNIREAVEFGRWLKDSLENEEFKAAQSAAFVAPVQSLVQSLPPAQIYTPPVQNIPPVQNLPKASIPELGGTCSMRLVGRPK